MKGKYYIICILYIIKFVFVWIADLITYCSYLIATILQARCHIAAGPESLWIFDTLITGQIWSRAIEGLSYLACKIEKHNYDFLYFLFI